MVTTDDVRAWVDHWLNTPVNGYFGSEYGADRASLLLNPLSATKADEFLAKLKRDIPLLATMSDDQLSIRAETEGFDAVRLYLQIGSILIDLGGTSAAGE